MDTDPYGETANLQPWSFVVVDLDNSVLSFSVLGRGDCMNRKDYAVAKTKDSSSWNQEFED